jgi:hypothetical protein
MENAANDSNAKTPVVYPKWMKAFAVLFVLMFFVSLYRQDWAGTCIYSGMLLSYFGSTKEHQMSLPVKVIWGIVTFSLIILGGVLVFQRLLSRGR